MEKLRPNTQRAKNAITFIWIVLALDIISFVSGYFQYDLLQTVANGGEISAESASSNDRREQIIAIVHLIVYFFCSVVFIKWFRRAYFNLHLKVDYLIQTEGWAAGSWFVPIVSLYMPYQIMKELYQETKELIVKKGLSPNKNITGVLVGWWWAFFILSSIMAQIVFRLYLKAETVDELINCTFTGMIDNIVGIPLALLTIKVIKDYSDMEQLVFEIKDEKEAENVIQHQSIDPRTQESEEAI